jgi:D-alanine-D-alanine ligase-like ATP-grasp enzyme
MVKDICAKEGVEGNLGWDICITENGPALIEANRGPGAILLITPYVKEKKGMMRYVLDKYLTI